MEKGEYKGLSYHLRLQLLQGITENLRIHAPGWLGLWGWGRLVTDKRETMRGGVCNWAVSPIQGTVEITATRGTGGSQK